MDVGVLYSGGKDSTLAACLLDPVCELTLLCCTFGVTDDYRAAMAAGEAAGFEVRRLDLDPEVARGAAAEMAADGYPRNGIQTVHEHALEEAASLDYDGIADGTRRDDRVPTVSRSLAQSIEDRYDVSHLAPLAGIGRRAIDELARELLVVETGPSEQIEKGDYEAELRVLLDDDHAVAVSDIFPEHRQSRVTGRR